MAERQTTENSGRFKFFLLGGLLGAIGGILFAPRSGRDTRKLISDSARDGKTALKKGVKQTSEKLTESGEMLAGQAKEAVTKGKEKISHEKETLAAAYDAGKKAYQEERAAAKK